MGLVEGACKLAQISTVIKEKKKISKQHRNKFHQKLFNNFVIFLTKDSKEFNNSYCAIEIFFKQL